MVKLYVSLCEKGAKNFNDVPNNLKASVEKQILADGYVINEDGTVSPRPINEE